MGVNDPAPENISGEKQVVHSVEHKINWGYVALAIVGLAVIVKIGPALARSSSREDEPAV
jgi:hypothetical protein